MPGTATGGAGGASSVGSCAVAGVRRHRPREPRRVRHNQSCPEFEEQRSWPGWSSREFDQSPLDTPSRVQLAPSSRIRLRRCSREPGRPGTSSRERPVPKRPGTSSRGRPVPEQPGTSSRERPVPEQPGTSSRERPVPEQPATSSRGRPAPEQPGTSSRERRELEQPGRSSQGRPGPERPGTFRRSRRSLGSRVGLHGGGRSLSSRARLRRGPRRRRRLHKVLRVCAEAVAAIPKPSTVAVVVPIKRLNVMDAFSTLETRRHNHLTEITPIAATPNGLL